MERILSTAVVMNTYKKYFEYERCIPSCGIQNVHFGGTLDDWKKVLLKTSNLIEFDVNGVLKRYIKNVTAVLEKFIDTYEGKVDVDFWQRVINIKYPNGSG